MLTIMLVEDNARMRRLLKSLFEMEGYRVVGTDSYDSVLSLYRRSLPDAVLMDVLLDGRETIELVRKMRLSDLDGVDGIPVVMTSAMDCRRECLKAGADQFILKPYLPDKLVQRVGCLVRERAAGPSRTF